MRGTVAELPSSFIFDLNLIKSKTLAVTDRETAV
jgi:hypothetical protein